MNVMDLAHETTPSQRRESQPIEPKIRRTACDRCRGHKLRCERTLASNEYDKCDRCAKAGLFCITSSPLPTGRPRIHPESSTVKGSRPNKRKKPPSPQTDTPGSNDNVQLQLPTPLCDISPEDFDLPFLLGNELSTPDGFQDARFAPDLITDATAISDIPFMANGNDLSNQTLPLFENNHSATYIPNSHGSGSHPHTEYEVDLQHYSSTPPDMPVNPREQNLVRLSQLNAALFRHLTDCDLAGAENKYSFLLPNPSQVITPCGIKPTSTFAPNDDPSLDKLAIGQMLGFVQEFLSILRYFLMSMPVRSAPRLSPRSKSSDGDSYSESDSGSDSDTGADNVRNQNQDASTIQEFARLPTTHDAQSVASKMMTAGAGIDYVTMLALINCYVSLVRLYRNALEKILSLLQQPMYSLEETQGDPTPGSYSDSNNSSVQTSSSQSVPAVLPDLHIDGFTLNNHRTLQIAVFMEVSMHLLWRVERAVAGLAAFDPKSTTATSGNLTLLKMMLKQEAATFHSAKQQQVQNADGIGLQSLRKLVKKIKRSVRENVCLQLEEADFRPGLNGFGAMVL